jgi:succinate dehydrogenase / fumarate reductase cytochrome b subunit
MENRPRPLSPHLQVWRWHITMFSSIMHRVTGFGSVAGLIMVAAWLVSLALGPQAYTGFVTFGASPLGLIVWFLLTLGGFVHLTGGIRHFIWDMGIGLDPKRADQIAFGTMALGVVLTIAFWVVLILCQKVTL